MYEGLLKRGHEREKEGGIQTVLSFHFPHDLEVLEPPTDRGVHPNDHKICPFLIFMALPCGRASLSVEVGQ